MSKYHVEATTFRLRFFLVYVSGGKKTRAERIVVLQKRATRAPRAGGSLEIGSEERWGLETKINT